MTLSGSYMWDPEGSDVCYLTVFNHGKGTDDDNLIIVGNLFMEKHYLVYDMSPLESPANQDYI